MIVTAHIKFSIGTTFLDNFFTAEDERLPGESIEDGVLRVRKHLVKAVEMLKREIGSTTNSPAPLHETTTQVIDYKEKENLEIAIDNATSLEELQAIKDANPVMTVPILKHCNRRMEELMNEKSFTNGLG
jgi:hypothetical protein